MKITEITRKEFRIELKPISGNKAREAFLKEIRAYFAKNKDVMRIIKDDRYLCNGIEQPVTVRIVAPSELGYEFDINPWVADDIAKKNGLERCASFIPVRIALGFEDIRAKLPPEYTKSSWWVHMYTIEAQTGDMFISGMGTPDGLFEINPYVKSHHVLSVRWVYGGRRSGIGMDQPILFQCRS